MMNNLTFDKEKLRNLPIKEVAVKLGIQLRKNTCLCFLHDEKTPSLHIYPKRNIWKCFGCGQGGGVIVLVEKYNGYNFVEACKWLSNAFGIVNYNTKQPLQRKKLIKIKSESKRNPNPEIYKWFFNNLSVTESVKNFIKNRQYPEDVIEKYNLKGVDDCTSFFHKCMAKWGIKELLNCGLAKEQTDEDTGEIIHRFTWWTSSLFFPFYDIEGNIIYIQSRTLNQEQEKKFKYVNLSEIETVPFNLPILKTLQKNESLVITEGVTDCISSCLMGKKAIGIIGAHGFKSQYAELLKDYDINVIPDNDKNNTGEKFANKIRKEFAAIGRTINILPLNGYKDISEYYMQKWNYGKNSRKDY